MNIYWNSFRTFFRIGLFTIGGGYAMIPLNEADVVDKNRWVSREDFLDLLAIAQSCPGIFAGNMSIFIGYKLKGVPGSVVCALGTILPSFLIKYPSKRAMKRPPTSLKASVGPWNSSSE